MTIPSGTKRAETTVLSHFLLSSRCASHGEGAPPSCPLRALVLQRYLGFVLSVNQLSSCPETLTLQALGDPRARFPLSFPLCSLLRIGVLDLEPICV